MKSFTYNLQECLCNNDLEKLQSLMQSPEFKNSNVEEDMYVKLITFGWNNDIIMGFAKIATDDQLATLIATAILHNRCIPLKEAFGYIKDVSGTIKRHHLKSLFLIACDNLDRNTLEAMIAYGCFDPANSRSIIIVFRRFLEIKEVDEELLKLILESHPGHTEPAEFLRDECIPSCRSEHVKELLLEWIGDYLEKCEGNGHSD